MNAIANEEQERQPFLPRVRMIWFFVVATLVAVALGITRAAEQGQALAAGLIFTVLFVMIFFALAGVFFLAAYLLGATERAIADAHPTTSSPFSDGSLPTQIVPPRVIDEHI